MYYIIMAVVLRITLEIVFMILGPQKYDRLVRIGSAALGSLSTGLLDELETYLNEVYGAYGNGNDEQNTEIITAYEMDDISLRQSALVDGVLGRVLTHSGFMRGVRFFSVCDTRQLHAAPMSNGVPRHVSPNRNLLGSTIHEVFCSVLMRGHHRCFCRRARVLFRYEYQHTGNRHVHALVWRENGDEDA
jgi:hypothetical protein